MQLHNSFAPAAPLVWISILLVGCMPGGGSKDGQPLDNVGDAAPELAAIVSAPMRILIIGGSSGIGLEAAKLALARGHSVTAMSRSAESMEYTHDMLTPANGDITNEARVTELMSGHDAVITVIGLGRTSEPVSVFSAGAQNVLAAMPATNVDRYIAVTGVGAGDSKDSGSFFYDQIYRKYFLDTVYADKDREEAIIQASAANWTIVRPGFLSDDPPAGKYRVLSSMEDVNIGGISRADVAHFLVAAAEQPIYRQATVMLTN